MKKLSILAMAAAALLGSAVMTSCVTAYEDDTALVDLSSFYLRGNMNNWGNGSSGSTDTDVLAKSCSLTKKDSQTYTITYTAVAASDEFAIANTGWSSKFCNGIEVAVGEDAVELASGGNNAKVTGQVPGNNYKMTVTALASSVTVKVELAGSNVPTFYTVGDGSLDEFEYDGSAYSLKFTASAATENLVIYSDGSYYSGSVVLGAASAKALTAGTEADKVSVTGLTADKSYVLTLTVKDSIVSASVAADLLKMPYINGDFSGWTAKDLTYTVSDDGTFATATYEFTASASAHEFGIIKDTSWSTKYTGGTFEVGESTDYVDCTEGAGYNNKITGLTSGTTYVITVKGTASTVSFKVAAK